MREDKRHPYADEPVDITVRVIQETDRAILVTETDSTLNKDKIWLPKSQIDSQEWKVGEIHTITIPSWLYKDKGFAGA